MVPLKSRRRPDVAAEIAPNLALYRFARLDMIGSVDPNGVVLDASLDSLVIIRSPQHSRERVAAVTRSV